ncbi:hypothetical protein [Chamaesiphon sp. VAR_48_metabat_403]|uniref:hypothetical protein n=1 Tax=Chamaesiphon sp. VAR_48_metabat_403 TaxID=2964700 RepID=UPI00286E3083|nr:hypothetical protein [Chamaesiphon sp. VAR_48_metabat_403]
MADRFANDLAISFIFYSQNSGTYRVKSVSNNNYRSSKEKFMRSISCTLFCTIMTAIVPMFANPVVAQDRSQKWIGVGKIGDERLQLDLASIQSGTMPTNDKINMEGRDGTETDKIPMQKVVLFNYNIGGRKRHAYTTACNGRNLAANPSWRTATSYIDYWPQYFSVKADSPVSQKMLKQVCVVNAAK